MDKTEPSGLNVESSLLLNARRLHEEAHPLLQVDHESLLPAERLYAGALRLHAASQHESAAVLVAAHQVLVSEEFAHTALR